MVNPDGAEYDIATGSFQNWRKNRQPIPGSTKIGIDLNRNWGYVGLLRRLVGQPGSIDLSRPEAVVRARGRARSRNFVLSRVVGGGQQITRPSTGTPSTSRSCGRTATPTTDVPRTMTAEDHSLHSAHGHEMANRNGYTAQQLQRPVPARRRRDRLAGRSDQRIFAFTIEMYPTDNAPSRGFYPPDSVIARETTRNDDAVLYFLEQAGCPYRAAGLPTTDCGPLYDDFELDRGWTGQCQRHGHATRGAFERGIAGRHTARGQAARLRLFVASTRS